MIEGYLDLSLWGYVGVTLLLTHITIASVTIFLHRYQAHNALTLHPVLSHFFRFWLWLTTGIVTREWVAVHRKHHTKCETPEDPHSPQIQGIWKVLFGGFILYRQASRDPQTLERYGNGTPDDWLERRVYSGAPWTGILILALLDIFLFGTAGLFIFAIQMIWIPLWAAGVINGIGHYWGYRNSETPDASRNLSPIGILIGGEELHNNHHAHSNSARLSSKWWEFDIGWFYIRTLALLGLARIRRVAPRIRIKRDKLVIDHETLRAVIRDRYHVLALYSCKVIRPTARAERRMSDGPGKILLRRVHKLMIREDILSDSHAYAALNDALRHSQTLETVYRFKLQLKELWATTANDGTKRLERLRTWCAEAELSGIEALQEFSNVIRGYTLKTG
jgi:stearoyl-CoA desaturase (delta-9 desaturase)